MAEYCQIQPIPLSDGSLVWNVFMVPDEGLPAVIFKCEDQDHAESLKEQIEKCVAIDIKAH